MKKIWICIFILISCYYIYDYGFNTKPHYSWKHLSYTAKSPSELWEERLQKKRKQKAIGITKFDKPNEYTAYHRLIRTGFGKYQNTYSRGYRIKELQKAHERLSVRKSMARTNAITWEERGPSNVPGRTRSLLILPEDVAGNSWIAGSVGGGIWKTTDTGQSWENLTPDLPNIAVTTLAQCAGNPLVIYAGTGESFAGDGIDGDGIFKSIDGGETWTQLASTINTEDFGNVNRIIVDPNNENIVLAVTVNSNIASFQSGIFRSVNGGNTWSQVGVSNSALQQIVADPQDFNVQYVTQNSNGILKSINGGQSWFDSSTGLLPSGRLEMAISPVNSQRLFVSVQGGASGNSSDLYISSDGGDNWFLAIEDGGGNNQNFLGGQGGYDNTIAAHPYNENIVYFGGVNLWKATIQNGTQNGNPFINSVDEENTVTFLELVNFGGEYYGGRIDKGQIPAEELVSIEIRFGSGIGQKAHRFTVGQQGSGVPDNQFIYEDYVDVPFEAWDIENNRQLMISFRDQQEDGSFNLMTENTAGPSSTHSREYLYIHNVDYNENEHPNIAVNGGSDTGHQFESMYFMWPVLPVGGTWNPANLPEAIFRVNIGTSVNHLRVTEVVTDAYGQNGGKNNFAQTTGLDSVVGIHPDHHGLYTFIVDEPGETFKIINVNDGGVYYSKTSSDPGVTNGDFIFAGNGYNTGQFYGLDKKPGSDEYIGGMQDNGSWRTPDGLVSNPGTKFIRVLGGDGFESVWNNADENKFIVSSQYNNLARTVDGGITISSANAGLTDWGAGNAPFITKITNVKNNPDVLYVIGQSGVWISENFGENWILSPINTQFNITSTSQVKVSKANNNIVWAGTGMTSTNKLHVSTNAGNAFSTVNNFNNASIGFISGLATHPTEDSTAFAMFSISGAPKVLKTSDLGQTWFDLSGFENTSVSVNGFPDVAVYCLLAMPHDTDMIWVGTDIGIIESTDGGLSWNLLDDNLPGTAVWDMKIQDDQVVIATHGRGIWSTTIAELPEIIYIPYIQDIGLGLNGGLNLSVNLRSPYDSTHFIFNGEVAGKFDQRPVGIYGFNAENLPVSGTLSISVISYLDNEAYASIIKYIELIPYNPVANDYVNDFNDQKDDDFKGDGFTVTTAPGFENGAINSPHDYATQTEYTFQLLTPIRIAAENANFQYDDVALIETGEPGSFYPGQDFYDYVIIEGSTDGFIWKSIVDGYDASFYSAWLNRYHQGSGDDNDGDHSLFINHNIDLLDTFNPGDTVLFRFRLHSDPGTVGWGWIIDNLYIQQENPNPPVVGNKNLSKETGFSFQVFPNPAQDQMQINYFLPVSGLVGFKIVDTNGRVVDASRLGMKDAGYSKYQLNVSTYAPGIYFLLMESKGFKTSQKFIVD